MNLKRKCFLFSMAIVLGTSPLLAQNLMNPDTVKAGMYDNGKMWTFDFPPSDFFKKTYQFEADKQWFEYVQKAALRFATYCSCSFVSPNGLVMTNHHCARESGVTAQNPGENLMENGFYAKTLADERKVPGLFVDQLQSIEDITDRVQKAMLAGTSDPDKVRKRDSELAAIRNEYKQKDGWKGLELETKIFYNGGKYALYGFKRYKDVRLVFMPELQLGYFGGDPDNFTYPRYNLDCSFFRVYDDAGKPLKTDYYFKFNTNGVKENEPVFVVGNPGTTRRGFTSSDHEYLRDLVPMQLKQLKTMSLALQEYNKTLKSDSLTNEIFGIENSYKAISGQLEALNNSYLMARRKAFENDFKTAVRNNPTLRQDYAIWDELSLLNQTRKKYIKDLNLMNVGPVNEGFGIAAQIATATASKNGGGLVGAGKGNDALVNAKTPEKRDLEELMLAAHLESVAAFLSPDDPYLQAALKGKSPKEAAAEIIKTTRVYDRAGRQELLEKGGSDPLVDLARIALPRAAEASSKFGEVNPKITSIRAKMGKMLFDVYGTNIPPDATFSLRINDGVVKGFEYNGTLAPYKTHFAGMYERYYSFDGKFPWSLPERWKNPPADLLKAPFNFVTTNDIIGGNSGSPMINKNKEAVGLIFDGNMESLAGSYIYEPSKNRAVGVHTGGMVAAMRYIYKADRLVKELEGTDTKTK
ncbi:MAG: S46 family peptidase [Spirosomataceae bacterium]